MSTILIPAALLPLGAIAQDPQYYYQGIYRASLAYFIGVTLAYPYIIYSSLDDFEKDIKRNTKSAISVAVLVIGLIPLGQVVFSLIYGLVIYPSERAEG